MENLSAFLAGRRWFEKQLEEWSTVDEEVRYETVVNAINGDDFVLLDLLIEAGEKFVFTAEFLTSRRAPVIVALGRSRAMAEKLLSFDEEIDLNIEELNSDTPPRLMAVGDRPFDGEAIYRLLETYGVDWTGKAGEHLLDTLILRSEPPEEPMIERLLEHHSLTDGQIIRLFSPGHDFSLVNRLVDRGVLQLTAEPIVSGRVWFPLLEHPVTTTIADWVERLIEQKVEMDPLLDGRTPLESWLAGGVWGDDPSMMMLEMLLEGGMDPNPVNRRPDDRAPSPGALVVLFSPGASDQTIDQAFELLVRFGADPKRGEVAVAALKHDLKLAQTLIEKYEIPLTTDSANPMVWQLAAARVQQSVMRWAVSQGVRFDEPDSAGRCLVDAWLDGKFDDKPKLNAIELAIDCGTSLDRITPSGQSLIDRLVDQPFFAKLAAKKRPEIDGLKRFKFIRTFEASECVGCCSETARRPLLPCGHQPLCLFCLGKLPKPQCPLCDRILVKSRSRYGQLPSYDLFLLPPPSPKSITPTQPTDTEKTAVGIIDIGPDQSETTRREFTLYDI